MHTEEYETLPTSSVYVHMTAGALAGIMEHCVMYPFDCLKTRMQAFTPGQSAGGRMRDVWTKMVRQEGFLRSIRGMSVMVVGAGPAHALYFSCYEIIKDKLLISRSHNEFNLTAYGTAGFIATILHDGVMNPAEVIHFVTYEMSQVFTNPGHIYKPLAHMLSGALAGAVAAAITTPLDVCKTLLNTQNGVRAQDTNLSNSCYTRNKTMLIVDQKLTMRQLVQIRIRLPCLGLVAFKT
ncbi:mitoferrin-1-like [Hylaeus volcanicus]|uniref:mitoferrin-1-like n=1 Tax=Hylaeus volcanicus TaxID=313075 RepID=UPI0023B791B8|nr:mitoferrin-1-like [Hylaeus volcanicus]